MPTWDDEVTKFVKGAKYTTFADLSKVPEKLKTPRLRATKRKPVWRTWLKKKPKETG